MPLATPLPKLSHPLVDDAQFDLMRALGYLSASDQERVLLACDFGDKAHIKDKRKSGEPYITHPIAVAEILAGFRLDADTIISAILHDTVEDTSVTEHQLINFFGKKVAQIVDGVTKLKSSNKDKNQNKASTFYKIFTATLEEPRVLIVKLADRLHNMSTMEAVEPRKRQSTAKETLDFYVPFARLMGLNNIADYLEILCYRNLDPEMYTKVSDKLLQHGLGRAFQTETIHNYLSVILTRLSVSGYVKDVDNRVMIYRQFFKNRGDLSNLLRYYSFMLVMETVEDCDSLATYLINKYQIPPNHIEDNIRKPLAGGNQSLILTYQRDHDSIQVVILTKRMLEATRLGILLSESASEVSRSVIRASLRNLQNLLAESESALDEPDDAVETIDKLMDYLHERKIVCFTPNGDAHELPRGATALDFAYSVSTDLGNKATGANINHQPAKLGSVLKSGQFVEIESDPQGMPKAEWLGFVATNKARRALRAWLKGLNQQERQQYGEAAFERALKNQGRTLADMSEHDWQNLLAWRGVSDKNALYEQITTGVLLPQIMVSRLFSPEELAQSQALAHDAQEPQSLIANAAGVEVDFSSCCHPIYGDPIAGHLSKNGLVVHRHKCYSLEDIRKDDPYKVIPLQWRHAPDIDNLTSHIHFDVMLRINQALSDEQISQVIYELRELNAGVDTVDKRATFTVLKLIVQSRNHIASIIQTLRVLLGYPNIQRLYQWDYSSAQQLV